MPKLIAVADDDRAEERGVRVELGDAEGRQAGEREGVDRRHRRAAGTAPGRCAASRRRRRSRSSTDDHDQHRRDREILDERRHLLGGDRDVAGEPDAHARRVAVGAARARACPARTRRMSAADREALVEKPPDLDQHERRGPASRSRSGCARARRRRAGPAYLLLDVREVERRRRLAVVEQRAGLLGVLPVQAILDALADRLEIVEVDQAGGVVLDEGALGGEAGAHVAHLGRAGRRARAPRDRRGTARRRGGRSGRPTSTSTPRYCSPAMRWRSSSMAITLGASRGSSSSMSLRRLR